MPPDLHYDVASLPDGRPCITVTGRGANVYDADALVAAARPYFTTRGPFVLDLTGIRGVKNEFLAYFISAVVRELGGQLDTIGYLQQSVLVRHRPWHQVRYGLERLIGLEEVPEPPP
jgi:hypothetical protein